MTTPVSALPAGIELEALFRGNAVSTAHMGRLAEVSAHLAGYCVNLVASCEVRERDVSRTQLTAMDPKYYPFAWIKSAAAQVLRIEVWLQPGFTMQVDATTLPTGATWIDDGGMDGVTNHYGPLAASLTRPSLVGYLDVTGCATATLHDLTLRVVSGGGFARVTVFEVALDAVDVVGDPDAPALDGSWTIAGNRLVDGSASIAYGTARLAHVQDGLRKHLRKHFQLSAVESDDTGATIGLWHLPVGTNVELDWQYPINLGASTTYVPEWRIQISDLHADTSATETWLFVARYRTDTATGGNVQVFLEGVGGAAGTWQTLTLAGTSGAWAWASASVTMPLDGSDGATKIKFRGTNSQAAGNWIALADLALIEYEV